VNLRFGAELWSVDSGVIGRAKSLGTGQQRG
jgi:hypothetical protein